MTLEERWAAVRASLDRATDRFGWLVRSAPDPQELATKDWTVAVTAAHVAAVAHNSTMVRVDPAIVPTAEVTDLFAATTMDTISDLNDVMLGEFGERDLRALGAGLRADVDRILRVTARRDPAELITWLGEAKIPLVGILAHLLNEILMHGRDIARASGLAWTIPPGDAAHVFDLFIVGMMRHGLGHILDNDEPPMQRRIAVEFRSAHTIPITVVLQHGQVSVEEPGGPTDIRLSFDPPGLLLMLFHRISPVRAALTGKVVMWGKRPWLLPAFMRTVRAP
jgi:uncharacterized protein (TIGR03083 family)